MVLFGVEPLMSGWFGTGLFENQQGFGVRTLPFFTYQVGAKVFISLSQRLPFWVAKKILIGNRQLLWREWTQSVLRGMSASDRTCLFSQPFLAASFPSVFAPLLWPLHEWRDPVLLRRLG
jgi:hypothetical protein